MNARRAAKPCSGRELSHALATDDVASLRHDWRTVFWFAVGVISPDRIFRMLSGEDAVRLANSVIMCVEVST
jgi:hypothetical protein